MWIFNELNYPGIADIFYILGYLIYFIGFSILWYYLFKEIKDKFTFIAVIITCFSVITFISVYLITDVVLPLTEKGTSLLTTTLDISYPILAAMNLIISLIGFFIFEKKNIKKVFLIFAFAAIPDYIANILQAFIDWETIYGYYGFIADILYVIDYLLLITATAYFIKIQKVEEEIS